MENIFCSELGIWLLQGCSFWSILIPHAELQKWSIPGFMFTTEECPSYKKKISVPAEGTGQAEGNSLQHFKLEVGWGERGVALVPSMSLFGQSSKDHVLAEWLLKPRLKDRKGRDMRTRGPHTEVTKEWQDPPPAKGVAPPLTRAPSLVWESRHVSAGCRSSTPALGTQPFLFSSRPTQLPC